MIGTAGNSYLLDTVTVIDYFNGKQNVLRRLHNLTFYASSITIGELFFGAYRSYHVVENVKRVHDFILLSTILPCNELTGEHFGQIKQQLTAKGRPIPENDIWIAATAMQYELSLVTRDQHFREIDGLTLVTW